MSGEALLRQDALHARSRSFRGLVNRTYEHLQDALQQTASPYVALSGGKDSLVALSLTSDLRPGIPTYWFDDELEHEGTGDAIQHIAGVLGTPLTIKTSASSHAGWFTPWTDHPFWRDPAPETCRSRAPDREWVRHHGHDGCVTGVRGQESTIRQVHVRSRGDTYVQVDGMVMIQPLAWWTIDDVWAFIASRGLPYHPVYDAMARSSVERRMQRVGPLPLAPRWVLRAVDPTLPARLEARYGHHW